MSADRDPAVRGPETKRQTLIHTGISRSRMRTSEATVFKTEGCLGNRGQRQCEDPGRGLRDRRRGDFHRHDPQLAVNQGVLQYNSRFISLSQKKQLQLK